MLCCIYAVIFTQKKSTSYHDEKPKPGKSSKYSFCQNISKHEQHQLHARSSNRVEPCTVCVENIVAVSVRGILIGTLCSQGNKEHCRVTNKCYAPKNHSYSQNACKITKE